MVRKGRDKVDILSLQRRVSRFHLWSVGEGSGER